MLGPVTTAALVLFLAICLLVSMFGWVVVGKTIIAGLAFGLAADAAFFIWNSYFGNDEDDDEPPHYAHVGDPTVH